MSPEPNSSRPCDVIGPFVDDRRQFGVLVGNIVIFENDKRKNLDVHLKIENLTGWNKIEDSKMRWTTGNALLPLGPRPADSLAILTLSIHSMGPYIEVHNDIKNSLMTA